MTTPERLLELKRAGQPFVIHLNYGRTLRIRGGDYISLNFARLREDVPRYRFYKAKRKRTQQLHLLASLPLVGLDRAHRLLDHFGSVQACITATADELEKVPGIGPKTAAAIRDLVSSETKQS
jgi:excinuclease UvrABC nuclease subunit